MSQIIEKDVMNAFKQAETDAKFAAEHIRHVIENTILKLEETYGAQVDVWVTVHRIGSISSHADSVRVSTKIVMAIKAEG